MKLDFSDLDLFCRMNVQSDLPHEQFVSFLARAIQGVSSLNSVKNETLEILVDDNDVFDPEKSRTGQDRWLYFRYTLEIDPAKGVAPPDYVASVAELLESLWSSSMDAVAARDFEDELPRNERRRKWTTPCDGRKRAEPARRLQKGS
jgi:hypothetical protein